MKTAINTTEAKLKDIHFETLEWKSSLQFIQTELQFVNHLLNSYVFEPNTPNLFERLQEFKQQIIKIEEEIEDIDTNIGKQENELGGMLECDTISCDDEYYEKHQSLGHQVSRFYKKFRKLKAEIFNYAGGILKKKKK